MAQDVGYDFAAGPTVTLLSADLVDGAQSALTSAVDFGTPTPIAFGFELILTTLASAVDYCHLEIVWSHDNTDFGDTDNVQLVTSVKCTASTDKKIVGSAGVQARYAKFRLNNDSGGSIDGTASNTALVLTDVFFNQV